MRPLAPASVARATVRSVDPPSTTMTSPRPRATMAATQGPIAVSSLRQGIMADTGDRSICRSIGAGGMKLKAPAQAPALAGLCLGVGIQRGAKMPVSLAVPDVAQGLLRGVAKGVVLVALLGERRDAAGQGAAVGGEIHYGPRPPA